MKRRILIVVATLLILVGIFILVKVAATTFAPRGKGGLQVTSSVAAEVFLSGKSIGQTPVCFCDENKTLPSGNYDIKIVPQDKTIQPYTAKISVNPNVLTAVDRTFLPGALASFYVLSLEKTNDRNPEVFISSIPDNALITLDGESQGVTPLDLKSVSASEHEVEIEKPGFAKKTVRIRSVNYFKLVLDTILGTESSISSTNSATPAPSITAISPTVALSPTPAPNTVTIQTTPTGFLRVRATPSVAGAEVGRVNPGESYPFVDENDTWYEITLKDGTKGWISKTYSTKNP